MFRFDLRRALRLPEAPRRRAQSPRRDVGQLQLPLSAQWVTRECAPDRGRLRTARRTVRFETVEEVGDNTVSVFTWRLVAMQHRIR